ncbi:hypothetical protein H5410_064834 [Solanum commersonii]|uniref:Uncharacterized protein n=1 Tax=Solanum commersonii TaxID=4109 RepID=A0A9J5VYA8_SOLCO|nr:hypothetical protein H5410_064834 [Solanum commersonii]
MPHTALHSSLRGVDPFLITFFGAGRWRGASMDLPSKMKRLASTLSTWSKMQFSDIYAKVMEFEERVKVAEDNLLQNNTEK